MLPPASEGCCRCVSLHARGGGASHNTSTGPMSFLGGTPVIDPRPLLVEGLPQSQVEGTPVPGRGTRGRGFPQSQAGGTAVPGGWGSPFQGYLLGQKLGTPSQDRTGLPPLPPGRDWSSQPSKYLLYAVYAACLLRSRRLLFQETERRQAKRSQGATSRGVKDPAALKRKQQRREEIEKRTSTEGIKVMVHLHSPNVSEVILKSIGLFGGY